MPNYNSPGIYIEEISTGARPIEMVGTSTAGFVGVAPDVTARPNVAVAVNNWSQFLKEFAKDDSATTPLAQAVFGFFENGGSRCYVVNIGKGDTIVGKKREGLAALEDIDEIAIVAAPGFSDPASHDALLSHCERLQDRIALLDPPEVVGDTRQLLEVGTVTARPTRTEPTEGARPARPEAAEAPGLRPRQSDNGYGAFYFPWIAVRDVFNPRVTVNVPPSGHIAGVYARTDATRGVHKAPANELVRGALNVAYRVSRAEQGELNENGVNCIRFFAREGIRVWGARTVAAGASEWRYVNVRRLFNMVEESIAQSTRWIVFEPNDQTLWKSIRRDVTAFLTRLWRDGALVGETAQEAFFVRCDAETNPPEEVDAGRVITIIGIAPVKPAEFIIFRIGQHAGGAEIATES